MTASTAYLEEGLALAIHLANMRSAHRQGAPARPEDPPGDLTVRVTDPSAVHALAERLQAIVTQPDPALAAPLLNDLFAHYRAAPELAVQTAGQWRLHLHPADSTAEALDAVKAASGLAALIDGAAGPPSSAARPADATTPSKTTPATTGGATAAGPAPTASTPSTPAFDGLLTTDRRKMGVAAESG